MANVSLKTDFKDGEKLFGQQLNNNFAVIKAALEAMNKIVWQDDPDDSISAFRGTTEEINQRDIIDGQLLYDTSTGETYIDVGSQRISTGSGNAIFIGDTVPSNPSTQLWINPEESILPINTEVVNSMEGSETTKAPSVSAAKNYIAGEINDVYSTDEVKTNKVWIDGKPIYRKVFTGTKTSATINQIGNIANFDTMVLLTGFIKSSYGQWWDIPNYYFENNSTKYWTSVYHETSGTITLSTGSNFDTSSEYRIIAEYTKTIDGGGN